MGQPRSRYVARRTLVSSLTDVTLAVSYVLPFKRSDDVDIEALTGYLAEISGVVDELIVVDGSDDDRFAEHHRLWADLCTHVPPREEFSFANGKVDGVFTGVELARNDKVVVADDDVRYDAGSLLVMEKELDGSDLVRPQNYFFPTPWHALWDSSRSLLNRAFARDYPGTLGLRRTAFLACGGYDGDTMFENLELIRTIEEAGGRSHSPLGLYVRREPPTSERFWSQRSRQAFDDLAQPWRLIFFLSLGPWVISRLRRRSLRTVAGATLVPMALAEVGRRRAGGARYFSSLASLMAPLWVTERAICVWIATWMRMRGGVPYRDGRIKVAANPRRRIRMRLRETRARSLR